ncbi:MAG TPA: stage V sporulation protein B [Clostridia bacterium]|nr:stage V sporulation protein B [Clostridia bacterium]
MDKNTIIKGTFILTLSNILIRLLGFVYRVLLSRIIGPEGMGVLQLVMPILYTSLALISAGIPIAVSRLVAQKRAVGDYHGERNILFTSLGLVISLSLFVCMFLIPNVNYIAKDLLMEPRAYGPLLALYPAIIMMSISSVFKGYFYGVKNFYPPALSELVEEIITMVLVLYLIEKVKHLEVSLQVTAVAIAIVLGELSSLLFLSHSCHRYRNTIPLSRNRIRSPSPVGDILKISGPVTLIRLVSSLSTSVGSILIPQRLVKSGLAHSQAMSLLGILNGMVVPLIFIPFTFVSPLAVVIIPNLSEDLARKNWERIRSKISKAIFITIVAVLPFGAIMAALAHPIGILLYNQKGVGSILELMAYFSGINALSHTLSGILNGLGKQNKSAMFSIIGETIEVMSIYFLVALPDLRIYGYIIGFLFSGLVVLLMQFVTVYKTAKLSIDWSRWFLKPVLASLLTISLSRLAYTWLYSGTRNLAPSFFLSLLVGILTYMLSLYITGIFSAIKSLLLPARRA